jgi:hypothetical protein
MSISSVNRDSHGGYPIWGFEDGDFFPVRMGMDEKIPQKDV